MSENVKAISDADFATVVKGGQENYIVDFWAEWCPPCKMLAPILEDVAQEYVGRVNIAKINVDQNPVIASEYGISAIPTLLFFSKGELVDRVAGAVPKQALRDAIKKSFQIE